MLYVEPSFVKYVLYFGAESRAITEYIAYAYADKGNPLVVAQDQKKMAIVSVWMQVESQQFDAAAARLAWELVFKPMFGKETDNAAVEELGQGSRYI